MIYGSPINEWTDLQTIIHWMVTCILCGTVSWHIIQFAKKKYNIDLFQKRNKMAFWQWAFVTLILVFRQNAFEKCFHKRNIPYGGIIVAITWGIGHFFTKNILTGIVTVISGLAFGSVYLLVNRDIKKTYPILWIMFVL